MHSQNFPVDSLLRNVVILNMNGRMVNLDRYEKEVWAEEKASSFDKMSEQLRKYIPGWINNMNSSSMVEATRCIIKAEIYEQIAEELRIPYNSRIESERRNDHGN
jgi:hypothetical protein